MKHFKHIQLAAAIVALAAVIGSCGDVKRKPNSVYMPDMAYSRAYETYALHDSMLFTTNRAEAGHKIYYNGAPVAGTMSRNETLPYTLPNDSNGYKMSAAVQNPLGPLIGADSAETARLYNINCGICHGEKGAANGPLATSGKVGGVANLTAEQYVKMADGTMYHSILYGKNNMGSYASQLSRKQRWQLVQYIRMLQPKPKAATATTATTAAGSAKADSAKAAGK
jgi:mono/diheme cytochrome c family protein